jgi:FkbM family methyltransferase
MMFAKQVLLFASKVFERLTRRCLLLPARTAWGERIWLMPPEPASTQIFLTGRMDPDLDQILTYLLKPGQTFIDVGAHIGYVSLLAHHLTQGGHVVALEPTPDTFRCLQRNSKERNIRPYPLAVWSECSRLSFNVYGQRFSAYNSFFEPRVDPTYRSRVDRQRITAEAITLDAFIEGSRVLPDVIKIDAESAELPILHGARRVLNSQRPVVIIEVGDLGIPNAANSIEVVNFLVNNHSYLPFEWHGRLVPHQKQERYQAGNLVFLPYERQ